MIGESFAIIIVILIMAVMIRRSGRKKFARSTLPLIIIPAFYLLGWAIYQTLISVSLPTGLLHSGLVLLGLMVGAVACLAASRMFPARSARYGYLVVVYIFQIGLAIAYLLYLN